MKEFKYGEQADKNIKDAINDAADTLLTEMEITKTDKMTVTLELNRDNPIEPIKVLICGYRMEKAVIHYSETTMPS